MRALMDDSSGRVRVICVHSHPRLSIVFKVGYPSNRLDDQHGINISRRTSEKGKNFFLWLRAGVHACISPVSF